MDIVDEPVQVTRCRATLSTPGARHAPGSHHNNFLTGVYCVDAPTGATEVHVPVSEGMLVIFPAWLQHRVDKNNSDAARISVSFNAVFDPLPTGGEDTAPGLRLVEE